MEAGRAANSGVMTKKRNGNSNTKSDPDNIVMFFPSLHMRSSKDLVLKENYFQQQYDI
jgi:hypothetical protein